MDTSFCQDYVLIELPTIPVPTLLVGEVFLLMVSIIQECKYLFCDLHGHHLPVIVDGYFHLYFLRSDFLWESERKRRRAAARKAQKNAQPAYRMGER